MWKKTIALTLVCLALLASFACGSESQEDISLEVAKEWTDDSIENVSESVVQLVVGEFSIVGRLAADVLADQVKERISWSYRGIGSEGDDSYRVVATASLNLNIDIPIIGDKEYSVSLPIDLWVNTADRTVDRWVPNIPSASVTEN